MRVIVAFAISIAVAFSAPAATKRVSRDGCAFSFDYPDTWTAVDNPEAAIVEPERGQAVATCAVGLRPPNRAAQMRSSPLRLRPYPIQLVFWNRSFRDSASRSYFVRVSDLDVETPLPATIEDLNPWDWAIVVRQGLAAAQQFTTPCCQGVRGTSWGHGQAKDGSTVTNIWEGAVVNDRKRHSVVIESDGGVGSQDVVDRIIATMSFNVPAQ
jgi:hypothetical protein